MTQTDNTSIDDLKTRLLLAEAVASAASAYMVALRADDDIWDEEELLEITLRQWRERRAIDAALREGGKI